MIDNNIAGKYSMNPKLNLNKISKILEEAHPGQPSALENPDILIYNQD